MNDAGSVARPRVARLQAALLTAMIASYFLWPGRAPLVGTSLHGLLLASSMLIYVLAERRLDWRLCSAYAPFAAGMAVSMTLAPLSPGRDVLRPVLFGLASSYLMAYYAARAPIFESLRKWVVPIVSAFAVCLSLLPFFPGIFSATGVALWLLSAMVERGLFFIFAAVFLFFVSLRSRTTLLTLTPVFAALFIGIMLTSLRGIWFAAAITLFISATLHRRILHSVVVAAVFVVSVAFAQWIPYLTGAVPMPAATSAAAPASPPALTDTALDVRKRDLAMKSADPRKQLVDFSNAGRMGYWLAGFDMWRDHPWFGVGLGRFAERSERYARKTDEPGDAETSFDPHNTFVALLAETGIVGFAGFISMLGIALYRGALAWRSSAGDLRLRQSATLALFLGLTAVGLTWDVHVYRLWWISLGLALGCSHSEWPRSS